MLLLGRFQMPSAKIDLPVLNKNGDLAELVSIFESNYKTIIMKFLILSCAFVLLTIPALFAQSNIPQPTHSIRKYAAGPAQLIDNSSEIFYYFNNEGNIFQTKHNKWDGVEWILDYRGYYTYNTEGRLTQVLDRTWDANTSTWSDKHRTIIEYHTDGQRNYETGESWNASDGVWTSDYISTTTFTATNQVLTHTSFFSGGTWGYRGFYTYDGSDRTAQLIIQILVNGDWKNNEKIEYTYSGLSNDYNEAFSQYWDEVNSIWTPIIRRNYQTVTSTKRVVLFEELMDNSWTPFGRTTINYNANNQIIEQHYENWDLATSAWTTNLKSEYNYNNDQSLSKDKFFYKDLPTGQIYLGNQIDYDYNTYPVSIPLLDLQANVNISPNPTNNFLQVQMGGSGASIITLFDVCGNLIERTLATTDMVNLSLVDQAAGTYFLLVEQDSKFKVLTVVKN